MLIEVHSPAGKLQLAALCVAARGASAMGLKAERGLPTAPETEAQSTTGGFWSSLNPECINSFGW